MNQKLIEILEYYRDTYEITDSVEDIHDDLISHGVEVRGNSFYCPIWNEDYQAWILLAGTKDKADFWVLKKIISLIKSGEPVFSILNGNVSFLFEKLLRYNIVLESRKGDMAHISFNMKDR